jgi:hypothetical protein
MQHGATLKKVFFFFRNDSKNVSRVFRVGDKVMAKWSDCRRYPAKVKAVLGNGTLRCTEVVYYWRFVTSA